MGRGAKLKKEKNKKKVFMGGTTLELSARRTYLLLGVKSTLFELPYSIIKPGLKKKVVLLLFSKKIILRIIG